MTVLIKKFLNRKFLFGYKKVSSFVLANESFISDKAKVNSFCRLLNTKIDSYSYLGSFSLLNNVQCGKFCSISRNVQIGLSSHPSKFLSTSPIFYRRQNGAGHSWIHKDVWDDSVKKTIIGNDVWIGVNVIIPGGIKIGDGSIIAANAVVLKDVEPYSIVGGVPARTIKKRFSDDMIENLLQLRWWDLPPEILKSNIALFQSEVTINHLKEILANIRRQEILDR